MTFALYTSDEIWEGADFGFTLAQIAGADGTFIIPTGTGAPTDITLNVYDLSSDTPTTAVVTVSAISATNTILSPPQTGSGWTLDNVGINFRHYLTAVAVGAANIQGGHTYRLEYVVTTPAFVVGGSGGWGQIKTVRDVKVRSVSHA